MADTLSLGERMKTYYEQRFNIALPMRMPVIIRIDGRCFHTFTRKMQRPFDDGFIYSMHRVAVYLCQQVATCVFAYMQSDEISLLLHNYQQLNSQAWFDNEVQKLTSITAGIASAKMSLIYDRPAVFDSRCFVMPEAEVVNYFVWRQQDASRNSVQMLASAYFSHKQLHGESMPKMQDMLMLEHGINWNDLPIHKKRGATVLRDETGWRIDLEPPIFTQDRIYIQRLLGVETAGFHIGIGDWRPETEGTRGMFHVIEDKSKLQ